MKIITYSIKLKNSNSEVYYDTVRRLTDQILVHSENSLRPIVSDFMDFLRMYNLEEVREEEEYLLELISFGILWRIYAPKALSVRVAPFITMSRMAELRKKHQKAKPFIDVARGLLTTMFLLPVKSGVKVGELPALEDLDHVCRWFEATGEFREQALRFILWRAYWQTKAEKELFIQFKAINRFAAYFETITLRVLGRYTNNVDAFLQKKSSYYRWREDRISCTRSRVEYHLNMVGAELMNRAFRKDFLNTVSKVVLLPGCMRGRAENECKAVKVEGGLKCKGCMPGCRVNRIREIGIKNNFEVFVIPHASDLSLWGPRDGRPARGVVASACLTTLVEGGWELKRYQVPAQCVLLDYCGCRKHWDDKGIVTDLNIHELRRILS